MGAVLRFDPIRSARDQGAVNVFLERYGALLDIIRLDICAVLPNSLGESYDATSCSAPPYLRVTL